MSLSNERSRFWREPARARQLSINRLMRDSNEFPIAEQEKIDPAFSPDHREVGEAWMNIGTTLEMTRSESNRDDLDDGGQATGDREFRLR
jgi:hypothetical protein